MNECSCLSCALTENWASLCCAVQFYFYYETISLPSQPSLVSVTSPPSFLVITRKSWKKNQTYFVFLIVVYGFFLK